MIVGHSCLWLRYNLVGAWQRIWIIISFVIICILNGQHFVWTLVCNWKNGIKLENDIIYCIYRISLMFRLRLKLCTVVFFSTKLEISWRNLNGFCLKLRISCVVFVLILKWIGNKSSCLYILHSGLLKKSKYRKWLNDGDENEREIKRKSSLLMPLALAICTPTKYSPYKKKDVSNNPKCDYEHSVHTEKFIEPLNER